MSFSIRVFCSKSWPKCINFTKSHSHGFTLQLTGNRQIGALTKEILRPIDVAVLGQRGHGGGYGSMYAHMTNYTVSPGQYVAAGQVIGYCGSTGGSTGPHLHFSVYYNGTAVNPAKYINIT